MMACHPPPLFLCNLRPLSLDAAPIRYKKASLQIGEQSFFASFLEDGYQGSPAVVRPWSGLDAIRRLDPMDARSLPRNLWGSGFHSAHEDEVIVNR